MKTVGFGREEEAGTEISLRNGLRAIYRTTGRRDGSFGLSSSEPVSEVMGRWSSLQDSLAAVGVTRLASSHQTHGVEIATHEGRWNGWLRMRNCDGHFTTVPGTALAVTVADCTPIFIVHPSGAIAALHSGWRGTAGEILERGLGLFDINGFDVSQCRVHLGTAICGRCYEVGKEVFDAILGEHRHEVETKGLLDVRSILRERALSLEVESVTVASTCTRCHNDQYFSHRAGDAGRQLGVIALLPA